MNLNLLPEEDVLDDPDDDDEADPTLPGDLWFRHGPLTATSQCFGERAQNASYTPERLRHCESVRAIWRLT